MSDEQKKLCRHQKCYLPDTPCFLGEEGSSPDCKHFIIDTENEVPTTAGETVKDFPWTGNTFGVEDALWLSAWRRPRVFAPVGTFNSGKTTFLVSLYLGLLRGASPGAQAFAGSYTFGGWENLAAYMRYRPEGFGPTFPPHTVIAAKGTPGLLHLAFRSPDWKLQDILLADGMGEWYSRWAMNVGDEHAAGARWVSKYADGFLFFIDCEALAGKERGSARDAIFKLAQRLNHHLANRPLALVWTKSDVAVPDVIQKQVKDRLEQHFPLAPSFEVSVRSQLPVKETAETFLKVLAWALNSQSPPLILPRLAVTSPTDPFLAHRGAII
jgi:GTPase SAR1 family protein